MQRKRPTKKTLLHHAHAVAKHAVVPHGANDYRPYLTRGIGIVMILIAVIVAQLGHNFVQTGSVLGQKSAITALELLDDTNNQREKSGENHLTINDKLSQAAAAKAADMFDKQYWAHTGPDGVTPWQWFESVEYSYAEAGENLARGFRTSEGVVSAWMNSQEHRDNILDTSYTDVGFGIKSGILEGKQTTLVVALYGEPQTEGIATAPLDQEAVLAATASSLSPMARLGVGVQSLTPAMLGSIILLLSCALVGLLAHVYRNKLPFGWRRSWKRHHGMYKALGMTSFAIVLVMLYGGGQI